MIITNLKFINTLTVSVAILLFAPDSFAEECARTDFIGSMSFCYNSDGKMISYKSYDGDSNNPNSKVVNAWVQTFDSNGNQTSYKKYDGDSEDKNSKLAEAWTKTFNQNGTLTSFINYAHNTSGGGTVKTYTCNGLCTLVSTETWTESKWTTFSHPELKNNRTYYTPKEAAQHVNHTQNNKITFTFK